MEVIEAITNTGMKYDEEERVVDVCQAIQEMRMESEQIGEQRGKEIGEQRGREIGEQRGKEIGVQIGEKNGELKEAQKSARNFYRMGMKVEVIAEGLEYDVDTVKKWLGL